MTAWAEAVPAADEDDEWDATMVELGYVRCRPCQDWHRAGYGECPINEQGQALGPDGEPW